MFLFCYSIVVHNLNSYLSLCEHNQRIAAKTYLHFLMYAATSLHFDFSASFSSLHNCILIAVFTALHGMQTWSSDENSVCPSVCLSVLRNACIATKRKKDLSRFLYHTKDHLA